MAQETHNGTTSVDSLEEAMSKIMLWATSAVIVGIGFNVIWAIIFWHSSDTVWMMHWLGLPIALGIFVYGYLKELK